MAIASGGGLTNGHRSAVKSRNRAILSIVGVISGGWLLFRSLGPQPNDYIVSDEERETFRGGDVNQTSAGNKTARAPEKSLRSP